MAHNPSRNPDLARAMRLFEKGDLKRAEQAAKAAEPLAPGPASQILAGIALKRNDVRAARGYAATAAEASPGDPRLLLNLAMIEFALNRRDAALGAFEKAAAVGPQDFEAQLSFGKALIEVGRVEEAIAQFQRAHQISPDVRAKGPMADALFRLGRLDEADNWAAAALAGGLDTADLRCLLGQINYARRLPNAAVEAFNLALAKDPKHMDALMGLSCAKAQLGDVIAARAATRRHLELRPVIRTGAPEPQAHVAIIHPVRDGYFHTPKYGRQPPVGANFQSFTESSRIQFAHHSLLLTGAGGGLNPGERPDLVLNNVVNAELLTGGAAEFVRDALKAFDAPVVNSVEAALAMSRAANAQRYQGAEGIVFPQTRSFEKQGRKPDDVADAILSEFELPVIIRPPATQLSGRMSLLHDRAALVKALGAMADGEIIAIQYIECRDDDGIARRYRLAVVGGEAIAANMHARRDWKVQTGEDRAGIDWFGDGFAAEEQRFLEDPGGLIGGAPEVVFRDILEDTPLDIYGLDFGRAKDGRIVVFEINASMALSVSAAAEDHPYMKPFRDRLFERVDDYLLGRALEAQDARASV